MQRFVLIIMMLLGLSAQAQAEQLTVTCGSARFWTDRATLCDREGTLNFRSEGVNTAYFVSLTAPRTHCSDVSYRVLRMHDSSPIGSTIRLAPGQTYNVDLGRGYAAGAQQIKIGAIGYYGGCNTNNQIQSWGVIANVAPVPR